MPFSIILHAAASFLGLKFPRISRAASSEMGLLFQEMMGLLDDAISQPMASAITTHARRLDATCSGIFACTMLNEFEAIIRKIPTAYALATSASLA